MSPEYDGYPTDQEIYDRDITNPLYGECNVALYDLLAEMKARGFIDQATSDQRWLMSSGHPDHPQRWVDLRGLRLTLGGWRGFHGVAMDVNASLSPADLLRVYETARRIAQERGLTVFVHEDVARSYMLSDKALDEFLEIHSRREDEIPIPDVIGFSVPAPEVSR